MENRPINSINEISRRKFLGAMAQLLVPGIASAQNTSKNPVEGRGIKIEEIVPVNAWANYLEVNDSVYDIRKVTPLDGEGAEALIKRAQKKYGAEIAMQGEQFQTAILLFNYLNSNGANIADALPFHIIGQKLSKEAPVKLLKTNPKFIMGYNVPVLTHYRTLERVIIENEGKIRKVF